MTSSPAPDRGVTDAAAILPGEDMALTVATDRAAAVLAEHAPLRGGAGKGIRCRCGRQATSQSVLPVHQADMLAAEGLLAHPDDGLRDALRALVERWERGHREDAVRGAGGGASVVARRARARARVVGAVLADLRALLTEDGTR